jgi:hypothetical protein
METIQVIRKLQMICRNYKCSIAYPFAALGATEIFCYTNMRFPCRQELTLRYHVVDLRDV